MKKPDSYPSAVRNKAERMSEARRRPHSVFRHLAQVGTLSWLFVLPVVLFAFLGRMLARWSGVPQLALLALALGLALGGYLVWRQLARSLDREHNHDLG